VKKLITGVLAGAVCPLVVLGLLYGIVELGLWDRGARLVTGVMNALPLWLVKAGVIGMFAGLAGWAFSLPADYIYSGVEDKRGWKDVRVWAGVVIGLEIIPYLFF